MANDLLWIDDLRIPSDFIDLKKYDSVLWATTFDEGISYIEQDFQTIHLDNDLSDADDRQGKHIFNRIEEYLNDGKLPNLKQIIIHSDNSSAVSSMMGAKDLLKDKYDVRVTQVIFKFNS